MRYKVKVFLPRPYRPAHRMGFLLSVAEEIIVYWSIALGSWSTPALAVIEKPSFRVLLLGKM